jgi:SAM-dependent methyltransferase
MTIEDSLENEKLHRSDREKYIGELLLRQRIINQEVFSFMKDTLKPDSLIIDACAGPEGSFLAASITDHHWVGNDLSLEFAKVLRDTGALNVTISDFSKAPFADESAGGVLFVFALNNVCRLRPAISEAVRILKNDGTMVVADSGPSNWIAKIFMLSLLEEGTAGGGIRKKSAGIIQEYFAGKSYSLDEYTNYCLKHTLGLTREEMADLVSQQDTQGKRRSVFHFQNLLVRLYFENIHRVAGELGLTLIKVGIMSAGKKRGGNWEVSRPVEVKPDSEWCNTLIQTRSLRGEVITKYPPSIVRADTRMTLPILAYKKKK